MTQSNYSNLFAVATLPSERWTRKILEWNIRGQQTRTTWLHLGNTLEKYCTWKGFDNWIVEAAAYGHWMRLKQDFMFFMLYNG